MAGWQDIETAPKDGSPMLLYLAKSICRNYIVDGLCDFYAIGWWNQGRWLSIDVLDCGSMGGELTGWMPDYVCLEISPTHWQPLPEPPE